MLIEFRCEEWGRKTGDGNILCWNHCKWWLFTMTVSLRFPHNMREQQALNSLFWSSASVICRFAANQNFHLLNRYQGKQTGLCHYLFLCIVFLKLLNGLFFFFCVEGAVIAVHCVFFLVEHEPLTTCQPSRIKSPGPCVCYRPLLLRQLSHLGSAEQIL